MYMTHVSEPLDPLFRNGTGRVFKKASELSNDSKHTIKVISIIIFFIVLLVYFCKVKGM